MEDVFGIDLGTTYSAIARINEFGQAEIIKDREGYDTTPSVVYFETSENFVVGHAAKNASVLESERTVQLIKRDMGTDTVLTYDDKPYRPETISSLILRELVENAQAVTGVDSNKVVITVPAYFGVAEREATRQAGRIAGLDVVGIVTEPVAAALSLGIRGEEPKNLFVYDLGGGTFDTTVMRVDQEGVQVLIIDGNRRLGGADWDSRLLTHIAEKFAAEAGLDEDPLDDEEFLQRLQNEVETAKMALSRVESKRVNCVHGDKRLAIEVTRLEFEEITRDLLDQTLERVDATLASLAEKYPEFTIDEVLLVGGSARMPMIEAALHERYGWKPRLTELDLAVAKGAALYGQNAIAVLGGESATEVATGSDGPASAGPMLGSGPAISVSNVLPRGLGVRFVEEGGQPGEILHYIDFLAHKNDRLPLSRTVQAGTFADNATTIPINLYEQNSDEESRQLEHNREITPEEGAVFYGLPDLPRGSRIDIVLSIDDEGHASVEAFEPISGQRLNIEVNLAVMQESDVLEATEIVAGLRRAD